MSPDAEDTMWRGGRLGAGPPGPLHGVVGVPWDCAARTSPPLRENAAHGDRLVRESQVCLLCREAERSAGSTIGPS